MNPAVYCNGTKLSKVEFHSEDDFENEIKINSKRIFGKKTIYLDIKKKIDSASLGGAVPDGILFDLDDPEDIKFYLVEVELAVHDFYRHIFPQITKFLAFYKNPLSQNNLIEKIFSFITSNQEIEREFKELLGGQEIYKSIKDAVEENKMILLIIDKEKPEIEEVQRVYTDTWSKFVIPEILNKYHSEDKQVFLLEPDFYEKELAIQEEETEEPEKQITYSENYHLGEINPSIVSLYLEIKNYMIKLDEKIEFNPQKYYISFRKSRNFAYLDIKNKKIKIAVMLPFEIGQEMIQQHKLRKFTEGIQRFYGRPSFEVTVENNENLDEVLKILEEAYRKQEE